jgi:hypothetical protein
MVSGMSMLQAEGSDTTVIGSCLCFGWIDVWVMCSSNESGAVLLHGTGAWL